MKEQAKELINLAFEAQKMSYSPYSGFLVGAALLGKSGKAYLGCNIENAAYSPCNCGERTAFFKAISEGETEFSAIAIVGNKKGVERGKGSLCAPCGVCRQVMMEFCDPKEFQIILGISEDDYQVHSLEELLPLGFKRENLDN
ncbi:cytidine deaminase [Lachnospiraceae bacterium ZAX-1]